jgi:hypothetical protein
MLTNHISLAPKFRLCRAVVNLQSPSAFSKPGIDGARLPREAMFVALLRKVDTMLPCANLARVEPNRSGSFFRGKGISVSGALSVETVLWLRNSVDQEPHAAAALRCGTRTR